MCCAGYIIPSPRRSAASGRPCSPGRRWWTTSTTRLDVLVGRRLLFGQALPASARGDDALARPVRGRSAGLAACLTAAVRLITRPAPWQVVPNVCSMLPGWPTSTQLARPMSPGMITGWPIWRYCSRHLGVARRETPASRPCDARRPSSSAPSTVVLLHLGDVVGHVVDQVHLQRFPRAAEELGEDLAGLPHQQLPVAPGEVGRGTHRAEVLLALRAVDRGAGQLPVGQLDAVLRRAPCGSRRRASSQTW